MLPSSWQGTKALSTMGSPQMSASLMVPGPALVMMTSEEGGRQQTKPTLEYYATGTEAGNANRPALVMITSETQQRGEDGERERVTIGRHPQPNPLRHANQLVSS